LTLLELSDDELVIIDGQIDLNTTIATAITVVNAIYGMLINGMPEVAHKIAS
jgi:Mg2+ and Co2+ transporter CorA